MKNILTIAKKELKTYFTNPIGYIFAVLLLIVSLWIFFSNFFINNQSSLSPLWEMVIFLFSLFIPAISMTSIADEKKHGTWELLLTLPLSETELVLGKFLGLLFYVTAVLFLYIPITITLFLIGKPDIGILLGGFLSTVFLSASYIACGVFASSLTSQSVVAFLISLIILLLNNFFGQEFFLSRLPIFLKNIFSYLSLSWHANQFSQGMISLVDVTFFLSWTIIFLILTILSLKSRNK